MSVQSSDVQTTSATEAGTALQPVRHVRIHARQSYVIDLDPVIHIAKLTRSIYLLIFIFERNSVGMSSSVRNARDAYVINMTSSTKPEVHNVLQHRQK